MKGKNESARIGFDGCQYFIRKSEFGYYVAMVSDGPNSQEVLLTDLGGWKFETFENAQLLIQLTISRKMNKIKF